MSAIVTYLTPLSTSYINKKYQLFGIQEEISKEKFLPVKLSNVDISIGSALRRIFMAEIPNAAFDKDNVKLLTNTSQMNPEVLSERMGYIIIDINDLKNYNLDDLIFAICDPTDPTKPLKNTTNNIMMVLLHKHLYIQQHSTKTQIKVDTLVPYNMLILTLNPGEEVHCVMKATMGLGRQHPRWQSSITMYKFETEYDSKEKLETNEDQMAYIGHERKQPVGIILTVESIGKLNSNTIIQKGIEVFKQKLEILKQNLMLGEKSELISVEIDENIPNLVKLKIINEDHTIGHVLEAACLSKLKELIRITIQTNEKTAQSAESELELLLESLSAYRKPHPLDNYIELSVRTPQKYELIFPKGQFDEINNSSIRLILLTIEDIQRLCDQLQENAKVLS